MLKTQHGFTLLESILGTALLGVIVLGVMKSQEISTGFSTKTSTDQLVNELSATIQNSLNNRAICSRSLLTKSTGDAVTNLVNAQVNPSDYNQFLDTGGNVVEVNKYFPSDSPNAISVESMQILEDGGLSFLEVTFNLDPKNRKKMTGNEKIKKRFILQVVKDATGVITSCKSESENLLLTSAKESCRAMNGQWINGKCEFIQNLTDSTPKNCGPGATYKTEVVGGKIQISCTPCTLVKKFIKRQCDKIGSKWHVFCYYQFACTNPSLSLGSQYGFRELNPNEPRDSATNNGCNNKNTKKCPFE